MTIPDFLALLLRHNIETILHQPLHVDSTVCAVPPKHTLPRNSLSTDLPEKCLRKSVEMAFESWLLQGLEVDTRFLVCFVFTPTKLASQGEYCVSCGSILNMYWLKVAEVAEMRGSLRKESSCCCTEYCISDLLGHQIYQ